MRCSSVLLLFIVAAAAACGVGAAAVAQPQLSDLARLGLWLILCSGVQAMLEPVLRVWFWLPVQGSVQSVKGFTVCSRPCHGHSAIYSAEVKPAGIIT